MGMRVMKDVFAFSKTRGTSRLVLLAIAFHADDAGQAYPGIERLSRFANVSKRTVIRCIQTIERLRELKVVRQRNGNRNRVNVYRVTIEPPKQVTELAGEGDTVGRDQVTPLSPKSSKEIIKESKYSRTDVGEELKRRPFDNFFDAMPSRAGGIKQYREKARQLFERLSMDQQLLCIQAAQSYRKFCKNTDRYPVDPYKFLEGEKGALWLDCVPKNKPANPIGASKPKPDAPHTPPDAEVTATLTKFFDAYGLSGMGRAMLGESEG